MPIIRLPNGEKVRFPDGMTDDEMAQAISESYPEFAPKPVEAEGPGLWARAKEAIGLGDAAPAADPSPTVIGGPGRSAGAQALEDTFGLKPAAGLMDDAPADVAAPRNLMPLSGDAWAKVRAQEEAEPLDERLLGIKPGDLMARAQVEAAKNRIGGDATFKDAAERGRLERVRDQQEAARQDEMYSVRNLAGNTADNVQNTLASVLKIGPTAVKGGADIARLFTGDAVGVDTSELMAQGLKGIDKLVASEQFNETSREFSQLMADDASGAGDLAAFVIDNPSILMDAGITTIGSIFLPAGAAKLAVQGARALGAAAPTVGRAAAAATGATVAAQNAADTFTDEQLASLDMEDRYKAATVAAALTVLSGMAFKGGAEGEIARRMAGDLKAGRTTVEAVKGYVRATLNEGAQEAGEELGGILGESAALLEAPEMNNAVKRLTFAGALGGIFGAGTHAATTSGAPGQDADAPAVPERREPSWQDATGTPATEPTRAPGLEDIASASSVDEAIAAATAVASAPAAGASPYPTPADIDALEEAAFMEGANEAVLPAPGNDGVPGGAAAAPAGGADAAGLGQAGPLPVEQPAFDAVLGEPSAVDNPAPAAGADTQPALTEPANLPNLAGSGDDSADWHPFPPESQTLGLPRAEMPQIRAEHRGAMVNFLNARGIAHEQVELDANDLKPTQREFSISKVQKAIDYEGGNRSILVSSDGHVLDGHHQWLAAAEKGEPVKAIRLDSPIRELLDTVREFPSSTVDTSSAPPANHLEAARAKHQRQEDAVQAAAESLAKRKSTGGQRARDRLKTENPFLGFLASHGVNIEERSDTGGQKGRAGGVMVPGYGPLYRRSGKRLDELAQLAQEAGFLTQQDIDDATDTGGTRKLADMIARAVQGREVIRPSGLLDAVAPTADQQLLAEAQRLGVDTEGKTADELYEAVVEAHWQEDARRQLNGASSIDEQDEIDRHADRFTAAEARLAAQLAQDADIPLDGGTPSDNLTDEEIDAIFGIQPGSARAAGQEAQAGTDQSAGQGAARAGTTGQGEAEPLLSEYTAADVLERDRQAAERARAEKAEADRLERERKREQHERETRQRVAATVDDFQLGQSAEEALAGQRDIFSLTESSQNTDINAEVEGFAEKIRQRVADGVPLGYLVGDANGTISDYKIAKKITEGEMQRLYGVIRKAQEPIAEPAPAATALQQEVARAKGGKPASDKQLHTDFMLNAADILTELGRRGDLKELHRAAGVRNADSFGDLPMSDQADAYVRLVQSGMKPVAITEDYNTKVMRMEREAEVRRLQSDSTVRQKNGKPFASAKTAAAFQEEYDLGDTHEVVAADGNGFELKRLAPARRPSAIKALQERQAADPETIRQEAAFARAKKLGTVANAAVAWYENGDISIEEFEGALGELEQGRADPAEDVDDGADIPLAFYATVTVQHEVFNDDGTSQMMDVPADVALESVREDRKNLEAMLNCMGG